MREKIVNLVNDCNNIIQKNEEFIKKYEGNYGCDDITINVIKGENIALNRVIEILCNILE